MSHAIHERNIYAIMYQKPCTCIEGADSTQTQPMETTPYTDATVPLDGLYFPQIRYRDHVWAGGVTEAFIEVWRADGHEKFPLIEDRRAHHNLTTTLGLRAS
ncbi:hypothetical protein V1515DRAFT_647074, partial [Lipomyces mesembrius]